MLSYWRSDEPPDVDEDGLPLPPGTRAREEAQHQTTSLQDVPAITPPTLLWQVIAALRSLAKGGDMTTLIAFVAQLSPVVLADVVLANLVSQSQVSEDVGRLSAVSAEGQVPVLLSPLVSTHDLVSTSTPEDEAVPPLLVREPAGAVVLSTQQGAVQQRAAAARLWLAGGTRFFDDCAVVATGPYTLSFGALQKALLARGNILNDVAAEENLLAYVMADYHGRQARPVAVS